MLLSRWLNLSRYTQWASCLPAPFSWASPPSSAAITDTFSLSCVPPALFPRQRSSPCSLSRPHATPDLAPARLSPSPNLRIPDPNESSLYLSLPLPLPLGSACLPACTSAYKSYYHARPRLQSSPCVSNVKQPPFRTPAVSCRLLPSQDGEPMISYGVSLFLSCHTKVHYCLVLTAQPLPLFQMVDSILPDPCTCSHRESQQEWEVCGDVTCGANITAGT